MNAPALPKLRIETPNDQLADFCRRHHIHKLSLFDSVLRDDFGPESDRDVLVEFESGRAPGLFRLASMEFELAGILGGRKVEMNTPRGRRNKRPQRNSRWLIHTEKKNKADAHRRLAR